MENYPDVHHHIYSKTLLGFWLYLFTDFILFSTLLSTFLVLRKNDTLLLCSFSVGMAWALVHRKKKAKSLFFFGITWIFGLLFLWMQLSQFSHLLKAGC